MALRPGCLAGDSPASTVYHNVVSGLTYPKLLKQIKLLRINLGDLKIFFASYVLPAGFTLFSYSNKENLVKVQRTTTFFRFTLLKIMRID